MDDRDFVIMDPDVPPIRPSKNGFRWFPLLSRIMAGEPLAVRIWAAGGGLTSLLRLGWACLALAGCSNLATTEVDLDAIAANQDLRSGDLQSDADELVRPLVDQSFTPGAVVGFRLPDGSMQFAGYGVADKATGAPPGADTLFAVGSLSKGFLAATAALLADKGVVSWSERVDAFVSRSTRLSADARQVTLLQLATHTSGMPRQPIDKQTLAYFIRYLFTGESFYGHFDDDYLMDYLSTFDADGSGDPQYSNIGYGTLAYLLSQRTGKPAEALVDREVIKPLGLHCTGYVPEALPCYATRARGYAGDQPGLAVHGPDARLRRALFDPSRPADHGLGPSHGFGFSFQCRACRQYPCPRSEGPQGSGRGVGQRHHRRPDDHLSDRVRRGICQLPRPRYRQSDGGRAVTE